MPVAFVAVAVQKESQERTAQAPYDTERPIYHAAAAHEHSRGQEAEDSLRYVPQKRTDKEQRRQLVEAAPLGKDCWFCSGLFRFCPDICRNILGIDGGKGTLHTFLYANGKPVLKEPGGLPHALGKP